MGIGRGTGPVGQAKLESAREKAGRLASGIIKLAKGAMEKVRAVFSELEAEGEKVFAHPPGLKKQEIPTSTPQQFDKEIVKLSDLLKVGGLSLLSLALGNPIPMIFAQRHAKNIQERIKARQKEQQRLQKQAERDAAKLAKAQKGGKSIQTQIAKHRNEIRRLRVLEKKAAVAERQNGNAASRAAAQPGSRVLTDADKGMVRTVQNRFVKMGFDRKDATTATNIALSRVAPSDANKFMQEALKEVSALHKKG